MSESMEVEFGVCQLPDGTFGVYRADGTDPLQVVTSGLLTREEAERTVCQLKDEANGPLRPGVEELESDR